MEILETSPHFWIAIIGAVTIKALMSKDISFVNVLITYAAGIYSGWAFTEFIMDIFRVELTRENIIVAAAIVSISGENLLRQVIQFSNSENMLLEIWKIWRGRK